MVDTTPAKIKELLTRGVEEVIVRRHLEERLLSGEKLRIKFGIDPTSSVLHLGHSVCLWRLRFFQDLGHQVIFLIGDFTARIGDPTGRITSRAPLTSAEIKKNMQNYKAQAGLILDLNKVEIRCNGQWWDKMKLEELMILTTKVTYSQVSGRADFKKRLKQDEDFTMEEFMYPVLQGYDSVELKADIEIGGTDQKFNMLMGRRIQKRYGQEPQDVITCPLLVGLDGEEKMSKTSKNYIALTEKPNKMFGKVMSIPDHLIDSWFELTTRLPLDEINQIKKELKAGKINPRDVKARLAREIVTIYYGAKSALKAEKEFERVFKAKKIPLRIRNYELRIKKCGILDLLVKLRMVSSKAEARRLVQQKGVKIGDKIVDDWKKTIKIKNGMIVQVGKRRFVKIKT